MPTFLSNQFSVTVPADPPVSESADWNARVAAATGGGTVTNFNTSGEALFSLDTTPNGNNVAEPYVKKSGGFAYRHDVLATDTTRSGEKSLWLFDDNHGLAAGETVYISWRQYFPAYMIDHVWEGTRPGGFSQSWKLVNVSSTHADSGGNNSNTNSEHVMQGSKQKGYIQGYNQHPGTTAEYWDVSLSTPCSGTDLVHQPAIDRTPGVSPTTCDEAIAKYGGLFSDESAYNYSGRGNRNSGAFFYNKYPGVGNWVSFKMRIKINPLGQTHASEANEWQVWAAYDNDSSWTELVNKTNVRLGPEPITGVWLVSYRSEGIANASRRESYTVYDELIVSSSDIALPAEPTSALKTLADSMAEGDWAELSTNGWDSSLLRTESFQFLDYAQNAVWDSIGHKAHIVSTGHLTPTRHAIYDEYTNTWTERSYGVLHQGHGYDHTTIDVDRRKLYWRHYNDVRFDIYDLDTDTYSLSSDGGNFHQVAGGTAYNEHLGVVHLFDERLGIMAYDPAANTWSNPVTSTQTDVLGAGKYHNAAEYSPTHRATIFGGGNDPVGSAGLGMVDSNGNFSVLGNAPNTFGPANNGILSIDPVSGDFLFLNAAGGLYKHNFTTDSWVNTGTTVPSILMTRAGQTSWNVVVTPIYNYDVLMFCTHNETGTSGQIYLHKVIQ